MPQLIDFSKSEQYTLSIRLSTDGFSFSVYNPTSESDYYYIEYPVNAMRSMAANVKTFLSNTRELEHTYRQVDILIHSVSYTTVPLEWFEDDALETLYYQNLPRRNNEIVLCNILSRSNSVVIFALDKLTHVYLSEKFPKARFFASVSPQIEHLSAASRLGNNSKLYVNVHPHSLDVFAFDKGKLLMLNTYQIQTGEDRLYYLTNVWKHLGLNQESDELHLAGAVVKKELAEDMKKYVRKIYFVQPPSELNRSSLSATAQIPFDMQSLLSCE